MKLKTLLLGRFKVSFASLTIVFFLFSTFVVHGQEALPSLPAVGIEAERLIYEKDQVIAEGNVTLKFQDMRVDTSRLTYDSRTGWLESSGPVVFSREGEKMTGTHFQYNVLSKKGKLELVDGYTRNINTGKDQIKGALYYTSPSVEVDNNLLIFKQTKVSTCDLPWGSKHYYIEAEQIKVIPGDKLIVLHGRVWVGKTSLWRVAKLVIDLHKHAARRQSYVPQIGYNKIDGVSLKTTTNYTAYKDYYGNFLFDYYQRTGTASGIEHQFPLGERGFGHASYYHQNGRDFQHLTREQAASSLHYDFGDGLKVSADGSLYRLKVPNFTSPDSYSTHARIAKRSRHFFWTITEANNATSGFTNGQNFQFHHWNDLGKNLFLDLEESYFKSTRGLETDSSFHHLSALSKDFKGWTAALFFEKTNTPLFNAGFLNRTPELVIRATDLPYKLYFSAGNFSESLSQGKTSRFDFQAGVPDKEFQLSKNFRFTGGALYHEDLYGSGDFYSPRNLTGRLIFNETSQLTAALGSHLEGMVSYRAQSSQGLAPLVYDTAIPYQTLGGEFSLYNQDFWKVNLGSYYDYKNRLYQPLVSRMALHLFSNWFFNFNGSYDPNGGKWQSLIAQADFWPLKDIRVQYWSAFSLLNGKVGYQDIALTKEWHDWEVKLVYRWHQQEVLFFFNLKAFPEPSIPIGINPVSSVNPTTGQFEIR